MKIKRIAMAVGSAAALSFAALQANATPVVNVSAEGAAASYAAANSFFGFVTHTTTEGFEGFTAPTVGTTISTSVGDFTQTSVGNTGGDCSAVNSCVGLAVLDQTHSPNWGRYAIDASNGTEITSDQGKWLDSNDSPTLSLTLSSFANAVGFYVTDPNDVGGLMDITLADGTPYTFTNIFGGGQSNKNEHFVSLFSNGPAIQSITFKANATGDGFGLDNVTIGTVPEPGTLALMGLGLVAMGFAARRRIAA